MCLLLSRQLNVPFGWGVGRIADIDVSSMTDYHEEPGEVLSEIELDATRRAPITNGQ